MFAMLAQYDTGADTGAYLVFLLVGGALLGFIPAAIAHSKGESFFFWWLFGALLFIVALPLALLLKPNKAGLELQAASTGLRKCPFCAEWIQGEAVVCRFCGRDVPPPAAPAHTVLHRGKRYTVGVIGTGGVGSALYAIWENDRPSSPIRRWAYTEVAQKQALQSFMSLEPDPSVVTNVATPPSTRPTQPRRPMSRGAKTLLWGGAMAVVLIAALVVFIVTRPKGDAAGRAACDQYRASAAWTMAPADPAFQGLAGSQMAQVAASAADSKVQGLYQAAIAVQLDVDSTSVDMVSFSENGQRLNDICESIGR